jgi:hypothetical protein
MKIFKKIVASLMVALVLSVGAAPVIAQAMHSERVWAVTQRERRPNGTWTAHSARSWRTIQFRNGFSNTIASRTPINLLVNGVLQQSARYNWTARVW